MHNLNRLDPKSAQVRIVRTSQYLYVENLGIKADKKWKLKLQISNVSNNQSIKVLFQATIHEKQEKEKNTKTHSNLTDRQTDRQTQKSV